MNKDRREPDYPTELESQFILRLPDEPAKSLRDLLKSGENLKSRLTIQVEGDMRNGEVRFDHWLMHGKIVDLPTIVESMKTIDNKSFYKTADICQMMICKHEEPDQQHNEEESSTKNKKKDAHKVDKKFLWPHGITPPTKNVRKRRFRKTLKKKYVEAPEIEKEVRRLLRADNEAVSVAWEVVLDEDDSGGQSLQTSVESSPAPLSKPEKKQKERSHKKETVTSNTVKTPKQSSNVVDIFGGAVSDSDAEDDHVNVETVEGQTSSHEGRKSKPKAQNLNNRRKSKNPPATVDPHVFQPPKAQARTKKSRSRDKPPTPGARDRTPTPRARDQPSTSGSRDRPSSSGARNRPSTSSARDRPTASIPQDQPSTSGVRDRPTTSGAFDPIPSTSGLAGSQRSSDDEDYAARALTADFENMSLRIEQLRTELEELKQRRQRTQHEIAGMENLALRQRFQDILHTLNQDIMYKEMEYQGMITLQTSEDI